jgi:hypothetical protein
MSWGKLGLEDTLMGLGYFLRFTAAIRFARLGVLTIALCVSAGSRMTWAGFDLFAVGGDPVTLTATLRSRKEVWNFFGPGNVSNGQDDNRYNFLGGFLRLGAGYRRSGVSVFAELMAPYLVNLPDNSIAPAPQGLLGLGALFSNPTWSPIRLAFFSSRVSWSSGASCSRASI